MNRVKTAAAVLFLVLPLALQATAASAPDTAFLRSLARPAAPLLDPLAGPGTPAPSPRTCSVSRDCGDGNTVACTGNSLCAYSQKGVTCDNGPEVACPHYCSMAWTCEDCPNYVFFCASLSGDCGVTADGCNGASQRCICPY